MNSPKRKFTETTQSPIFDPFPEPRAFPDGWDFGGFQYDRENPSLINTPSTDPEQPNP